MRRRFRSLSILTLVCAGDRRLLPEVNAEDIAFRPKQLPAWRQLPLHFRTHLHSRESRVAGFTAGLSIITLAPKRSHIVALTSPDMDERFYSVLLSFRRPFYRLHESQQRHGALRVDLHCSRSDAAANRQSLQLYCLLAAWTTYFHCSFTHVRSKKKSRKGFGTPFACQDEWVVYARLG